MERVLWRLCGHTPGFRMTNNPDREFYPMLIVEITNIAAHIFCRGAESSDCDFDRIATSY